MIGVGGFEGEDDVGVVGDLLLDIERAIAATADLVGGPTSRRVHGGWLRWLSMVDHLLDVRVLVRWNVAAIWLQVVVDLTPKWMPREKNVEW
jgi:hypothetical protein